MLRKKPRAPSTKGLGGRRGQRAANGAALRPFFFSQSAWPRRHRRWSYAPRGPKAGFSRSRPPCSAGRSTACPCATFAGAEQPTKQALALRGGRGAAENLLRNRAGEASRPHAYPPDVLRLPDRRSLLSLVLPPPHFPSPSKNPEVRVQDSPVFFPAHRAPRTGKSARHGHTVDRARPDEKAPGGGGEATSASKGRTWERRRRPHPY